MALQLFYGNYGFPVGGAAVTTRTDIVRSDSGRPLRWRVFADVEFYLKGSGPAELSALENSARVALSVPYQNLQLLDPDTGLRTATQLLSPNSVTGVVIVAGPTFADPAGPEYVTLRTGRFTAMAEYVFRGADRALVSYTETVSIQGTGGPLRVWRLPVNFPAVRQQVSLGSVIRYTQSGAAVGHLFQPLPQVPYLDPDLLVAEPYTVSQDVGQPLGQAWVNKVTRWSYVFEANELLPMTPQLPVM